jgi:CRP/FNR family transcriptional regulator
VRFDDYPVAASPPQGVNPCDDCALRRLEAFLPASPEELKTIQSFRVGARRVEAGGSIIEEHRPSTQLFTLYSGWAFRYKTLTDGRRQILSFCCPAISSACRTNSPKARRTAWKP